MAKVIVTRGVPASGKSTWAKKWVAKDPSNRTRVNRDNLRWTLGIKDGLGTEAQENEVSYWERKMVQRAIERGKDVVIDGTNMPIRRVRDWHRFAARHGASDFEVREFPITFEEAYGRDIARGQSEGRAVGKGVLEHFFDKYIHASNGKDIEPYIPGDIAMGGFEKYEADESLPGALIIDIDGTLAHSTGRSPYDLSRVHEDVVDPVVFSIVDRFFEDHAIIVLSGRDESCRDVTANWLTANKIYFDELFMRPEGDKRKDSVVKNELFETHIARRWNVRFALDDREQVVRMWREKGVKCLQVEEGDF